MEVGVNLVFFVWDNKRQWVDTDNSYARMPEANVAYELDCVYQKMQDQVDSSGHVVVICHRFDNASQEFQQQFPPKLITPIQRSGIIERVKPIIPNKGANN